MDMKNITEYITKLRKWKLNAVKFELVMLFPLCDDVIGYFRGIVS